MQHTCQIRVGSWAACQAGSEAYHREFWLTNEIGTKRTSQNTPHSTYTIQSNLESWRRIHCYNMYIMRRLQQKIGMMTVGGLGQKPQYHQSSSTTHTTSVLLPRGCHRTSFFARITRQLCFAAHIVKVCGGNRSDSMNVHIGFQ